MIKKRVVSIYSMVIFIFACLKASSQTCEVLNPYIDNIYSTNEIYKLEKRVCKMLKEQNAMPDNKKINIYYIPNYEIPYYCTMPPDSIEHYYLTGKSGWKLKKNDFANGFFLKKLSRESTDRFKKVKGYINAQIIVTNSSGKLIAFGDTGTLYIAEHYSSNSISLMAFIAEQLSILKIKYLFNIPDLWAFAIFGVTEKNKIIVFLYGTENKAYTIEEFIDMNSKDKSYKHYYD
ncbi:hypothetical protein [uncultured Bacteroides sp.]|uniref:hypothetical protein n=1 Tax=uncultured Bacteroides sp. TaxID=162156 RepID=UPI0025D429C1|nr:hypothetical protein [uncultured Bacteroides sp.]